MPVGVRRLRASPPHPHPHPQTGWGAEGAGRDLPEMQADSVLDRRMVFKLDLWRSGAVWLLECLRRWPIGSVRMRGLACT